MEQSPSWKPNGHSASQEIPHLSRNPKVHYHVHKSLLIKDNSETLNNRTVTQTHIPRILKFVMAMIGCGISHRYTTYK